MSEHLPAASYACLVGNTGCVACRPDPYPCDEFKVWDDENPQPWCIQCGWTSWWHDPDLTAHLRNGDEQ